MLWAWDGGGGASGVSYIKHVKGLSKWTGVDGVVEALVVGVLSKISGTTAFHGYGFTCFFAYVFLSSLAFVFLPGDVLFEEEAPTSFHMKMCEKFRSSRVRKATLSITLVVFLGVLSLGLTVHSMRLWIPKDTVQWYAGHRLLREDQLPQPLRQLTEPAIHRIEEAIANQVDLRADTSVAGCIRRNLKSESMHTLVGTYLVFFCVIFLPVAYSVINTAYALAFTELPEDELKGFLESSSRGDHVVPWPQMNRLRIILWDLSMLDVCAVAVALAVTLGTLAPDLQGDLLEGYAF